MSSEGWVVCLTITNLILLFNLFMVSTVEVYTPYCSIYIIIF